jgi:hypothetical protein
MLGPVVVGPTAVDDVDVTVGGGGIVPVWPHAATRPKAKNTRIKPTTTTFRMGMYEPSGLRDELPNTFRSGRLVGAETPDGDSGHSSQPRRRRRVEGSPPSG